MRWVQANAGHRSPSISHPALANMASVADVMMVGGCVKNSYSSGYDGRSRAYDTGHTVVPLSSASPTKQALLCVHPGNARESVRRVRHGEEPRMRHGYPLPG